MTGEQCRKIARVWTVLWAGWWTYFALAVGVSEAPQPWQIGVYPLMVACLFIGSAFLAWRYEGLGRWLLMLEGLTVLIGYPLLGGGNLPLTTVVFVLGTLALPPLLAAGLFFLGVRQPRRA
jgi:hypothetical protein